MAKHRIMYVCTFCADNNPEGCGRFSREDLRVMPNGDWLCADCFDDYSFIERGGGEPEDAFKTWSEFQAPPEYVPHPPHVLQPEDKR